MEVRRKLDEVSFALLKWMAAKFCDVIPLEVDGCKVLLCVPECHAVLHQSVSFCEHICFQLQMNGGRKVSSEREARKGFNHYNAESRNRKKRVQGRFSTTSQAGMSTYKVITKSLASYFRQMVSRFQSSCASSKCQSYHLHLR